MYVHKAKILTEYTCSAMKPNYIHLLYSFNQTHSVLFMKVMPTIQYKGLLKICTQYKILKAFSVIVK